MAGELDGKVVAVTGGVSGIGRGIVDVFLEEGARIVVGDIDDQGGRALEEELGKEVVFQRTDVTVAGDMEALVARAVSEFGELNVMVNNAGALASRPVSSTWTRTASPAPRIFCSGRSPSGTSTPGCG